MTVFSITQVHDCIMFARLASWAAKKPPSWHLEGLGALIGNGRPRIDL